jgi:xylulokinase
MLASATEEHQPFASPHVGWAEQHPEDWWRAATLAVRNVLATAALSGEDISCVGLSGQMHGAVLLDRYRVYRRVYPALKTIFDAEG